jgi:DNA-binding NarL/FixJ family response regulator
MKASNSKIRILVNDDQDIFREGILQIIRSEPDFQLAASTRSTEDILDVIATQYPDVVIMAVCSNAEGITATRKITERFPKIPVLAISMFKQEQNIIGMLKAGAKGCIVRNSTKEEMISAIKSIYNLEEYFSHEILGTLGNIIANGALQKFDFLSASRLTDKDKSLLRLLCQELTLKEIAVKMQVSLRCVENSKNRLCRTLKKSNSIGLVMYAIINGIYNPFNPPRESLPANAN